MHPSFTYHDQSPLTTGSRNQGAKWIKSLTKDRLGQFVGGHFNEVNLGAVLFFERKDDEKHVQMKMWSAPGKEKPSFDDVMKIEDKEWKKATKGVRIGPSCESVLEDIIRFGACRLTLPVSFSRGKQLS